MSDSERVSVDDPDEFPSAVVKLEDKPGVVYVIGLNVDDIRQPELVEVMEMLERRFDEANWLVLNLPTDVVEVTEMNYEEAQDIFGPENIAEVMGDG